MGGVAMNLVMLFTFRLIGFGWSGSGILTNPKYQSIKLIAVWKTIEPLPRIVNAPIPMVIGLVLFGIAHAYYYDMIRPTLGFNWIERAERFGGMLFVMCFLFWEFFTPFNLFHEPLYLIALELAFWAAIAWSEAFVIAYYMEREELIT